MTPEVDLIIEKALSMSPSERALIAHCLISSIDHPVEEDVEKEWLDLAERRIQELENGKVEPVSWQELKSRLRK